MYIRILLIIVSATLIGCATNPSLERSNKHIMAHGNKKIIQTKARVTYYDGHEDKFGSKIACSKKLRAKEGVTVAAEKAIPFQSLVEIEALRNIVGNGKFVVQDRGKFVNSRKASRGQYMVIDVFVSNRKKLKWLTNYMEEVVPITLEM